MGLAGKAKPVEQVVRLRPSHLLNGRCCMCSYVNIPHRRFSANLKPAYGDHTMSRWDDMNKEARMYGQEANLSHLTKRVSELESQVRELFSLVQGLTDRLEDSSNPPEE